MAREFNAVPAERKAQHLFIGLVAPSGAGKSYSALELAIGMQSVFGGEIAVIDTENNRALAYADDFRKPDGSPAFMHIPFEPPHGSLDYVAAIEYAAKIAKTVIVDGASNEHDNMLEFHESEVQRMAGNDYAKQERVKMLAWAKPKAARRELVKTVTRCNANVIMCFRAKETSKPGKDERTGKNVVIPMGFMPMAAQELTFEMSLSALLLPGAQGIPTWNPEFPGERIAVKLPKQFDWLREHSGPLNRDVGRRLALWAVGQDRPAHAPAQSKSSEPLPESPDAESLYGVALAAAMNGDAALTAHLKALSKAEVAILKPYGQELRARAKEVDAAQAARADVEGEFTLYGVGDDVAPTTLTRLSEYLDAYEETLRAIYTPNNGKAVWEFDQANKPLIEQYGLTDRIAELNKKIRVPAKK